MVPMVEKEAKMPLHQDPLHSRAVEAALVDQSISSALGDMCSLDTHWGKGTLQELKLLSILLQELRLINSV